MAVTGYESWVDRQIREARERGEFDNLPGAGKPIPNIRRRDDNWWVKGLLERENIAPLLPTSLSLRKEAQEIGNAVADVRTEEDVREIVADLNERIRDSRRRRVDGPPIWVHTVNADRIVQQWRERRSAGG